MSEKIDLFVSGFNDGVLQTMEMLIDYMEHGNIITLEKMQRTLRDSIRIDFDRKYTSYQDYLKSEEWTKKSEAAKERAEWRCQLCNKRGSSLHTHHKTYDRIGREKDSDLIVLCAKCHAKFHGKG